MTALRGLGIGSKDFSLAEDNDCLMPHRKSHVPVAPPQRLTSDLPLPAPLSPHWAFVVQLREGTPLTAEGLQGRVEHLISGKASVFNSLEELRAFMDRVLGGSDPKVL